MEREQPPRGDDATEPDSNTSELLAGEWGSNAIAHDKPVDLEERHRESLQAVEELTGSSAPEPGVRRRRGPCLLRGSRPPHGAGSDGNVAPEGRRRTRGAS